MSNVKFGLIKYDFSLNLGDIQSIALRQFIKADMYFDRDWPSLTKIPEDVERVKLIANAYWAGFDDQESTWLKEVPFDKKINPLWISSHFDGGCVFTNNIINYLKRFEPIGCRDKWSEDKLKYHGLNTYFSNCITVTLKNTKNYRTDDIYIVDVPKNIYKHFPKKY